MRRIALAVAATAALSIAAPADATITVAQYTATGTGSGGFTLEYDSIADSFAIVSLDFTVPGQTTTWDASNSVLFQITSSDLELGGALNGIGWSTGTDDFVLAFNPMLTSQSGDLLIYTLTTGPQTSYLGQETITSQVIRGPGFVPEPASWAMMLLGFGAIGLVFRRRKAARSRLA